MGNCFIYSSKKSRNYFVPLNFSFTSTSSPWATYRHLTDICAWGWGIWTLLGEGGEVKSFQLNTNMEYVKGKQWLRRKGLRGFKVWPVYRDFDFHQKKLGKAFEHNVCPKGWEFEQTYLQKFKVQGWDVEASNWWNNKCIREEVVYRDFALFQVLHL